LCCFLCSHTSSQAVKEFKKADKNNNGVLSPQEFMDLVRSQVNTLGRQRLHPQWSLEHLP
jgi:hypothetical protein